MIPRYTHPDMAAIWQDENRYNIWLAIESHAADAMAELGTIPQTAATAIRNRGGFNISRIAEIEAEVKHDVIAFLTSVTEHVGEEARFLHQGMTSSDVLDTCLAVQLTQAADLILEQLDVLLAALRSRAEEFKYTPCMGRSHGIHAEPTTFGLKLATFYAEFARARTRLEHARADVATCAISGPVGTFATVDPRVEAYVAEKMGLSVEPVSTQVIPRDRHAMFFATLGVLAGSMERLVTEIRHLQRTEVREAQEAFSKGQKGSSAMPHKKNPIGSENITGLARLIRSAVIPAMEDIALWHERDISHSSVERVIAPDATILTDYALRRLGKMVQELVVYPDAMRRNLDMLGGTVYSQRILLALTQKGMSREDAYAAVQAAALEAWEAGKDFKQLLGTNTAITEHLSVQELDELFDPTAYSKHVDTIFARVFPPQSKQQRKAG
ncbi:MAG: adenylosuccinate lyase [Proteobacteria bacterium]|nr:adenylosuccinate lyase [Pseudomonadota bacterium]